MSTASWRLRGTGRVPTLLLSLAVLGGLGAGPVGESKTDAPKGPDAKVYEPIGRLVIMHSGRRKPLDTVARQEVKIITGRQEFEPLDSEGRSLGKWEPTPAFFSWMSAPEVWDDRRFLLVEFLPLKEHILAADVQALLRAISEEEGTPADLKQRIEPLLKADRIGANDLLEVARHPALSDQRQDQLEAFAHRLQGADHFVSPSELENAQIRIDGKTMSFRQWVADVARRSRPMGMGGAQSAPKQTLLESKVLELGNRLARYQLIRGDRDVTFLAPVDHTMPRPSGKPYLEFLARTVKKYDELREREKKNGLTLPPVKGARRDKSTNEIMMQTEDGRELPLESLTAGLASPDFGLTSVEIDGLATLARYFAELPSEDRLVPGLEQKADEALMAWLKEDADWAPLSLILRSPEADLLAAGYPADKLAAFREAWAAARDGEAEKVGGLDRSRTEAVENAARSLAEAIGGYPSPSAVGREIHYNAFAPFYKAPIYYGLATLLLGACLTFLPRPSTPLARVRKVLYILGMICFVGAIGLEVYGFYLRVAISGWAPVTNLYETVIWVALVAAAIGLILELIYRKAYPAAAASGVAMLCTIIAANATSVLNPNIESLQPVLRSNYWLTIHVLTIVSSYAAFALAMGLGLIGLWYYLTATYRRDVSFRDLSAFLVPGIPATILGLGMAYPNLVGFSLQDSTASVLFYVGWAVASAGILLVVMSVSALAGEMISRLTFRESAWKLSAAASEESPSVRELVAATAGSREETLAAVGAGSGGGGSATATLPPPPTDTFRSRYASGRPELTPRERSMQATASILKPLAGYLYRAVQVGVLLCAAGTILGGVWADYSWGRFWGWDPKEVSALVTLLAYLIPLHGRFAGWINTFGLICASVFCFNFVILAWYGVNFLLGVGLHSYGFAEGGNQGKVLLTTLVVNAVVCGTIYRRHLAYKNSPAAA